MSQHNQYKYLSQCLLLSLICLLLPNSYATKQTKYQIIGVNEAINNNISGTLNNQQVLNPFSSHLSISQMVPLVKKALAPYGYFYPNIIITPAKKAEYDYTINIIPGPTINISKVKIKIIGNSKKDQKIYQMITDSRLRSNQPFIPIEYDQYKQTLLEHLHAQGYVDASLKGSQINVNLDKQQVLINLIIHLNQRHFFGETTFLNSTLSPALLKRYLDYKAGDPFNRKKIQTLHSRLINSHYFSHVHIDNPLATKHAKTTLPVKLHLLDHKPMQYSAGFGFDDALGFRINLKNTIRRLNQWGHTLNANYLLSKELTSLSATYGIPGAKPYIDAYRIKGQYELDNDLAIGAIPTDNEIYHLSIAQDKQIDAWHRNISINYLMENAIQYAVKNKSEILYPELIYSNPMNHLPHPIISMPIKLDVSGNWGKLFSKTNFFKIDARSSLYLQTTPRTRLLLAGEFGIIKASEWDHYPLSLKFFAGGPMSIRGFTYRDLGPGKYLKLLKVEGQYRVYNLIYLTAFRDMGIASNQIRTAMHGSVGIGLMYASSVGQLQLSLAKPDHDSTLKLQLSFNL